MDSTFLLTDELKDGILKILPIADTPHEPTCPICFTEYGTDVAGVNNTHLDWLIHLPHAFTRTSNQQEKIEAVRTPCNHTFCIFCAAKWLLKCPVAQYTCPICRTLIQLPTELNAVLDKNDEDDAIDPRVEGIAQSLHVSFPTAQEIFDILNLSTQELLTTEESMPFVWCEEAMLADLPRIMVSVARRFYHQDMEGGAVPPDLPFLKLHRPMDQPTTACAHETMHLEFFQRFDAPLAKHADARTLYKLLCRNIESRKDPVGNDGSKCLNWEEQAKILFRIVVEENMADSDGGVGKSRWEAFVWCVIKALLVWQAYCERIQELIAQGA